jgi:glycosyltransferase involved in cell wall biosynthesis
MGFWKVDASEIYIGENMIRIGLGITTYNRKESLKILINSIRKNTQNISYHLFCAVDGSTDGTVEMLMKEGIEFTYGPTVGPNRNKNRIIRRFSQFNAMFIIEDDMEIISPNWVELYTLASALSNIPYFTYKKLNLMEEPPLQIDSIGNIQVAWMKEHSSQLLYYTRRVIEKVGGIDDRFTRYYYGAREQFDRITNVGLLPKNQGIPHVLESQKYIIPIEIGKVPKIMSEDEKEMERKASFEIYKRLSAETKTTGNYYRKL